MNIDCTGHSVSKKRCNILRKPTEKSNKGVELLLSRKAEKIIEYR